MLLVTLSATAFLLSSCSETSSSNDANSATTTEASKASETTTQETETPDPQEALAPQGEVVTVTGVVSGDTVKISPAIEGRDTVRLIGIDAPETARTGNEPQPFGRAAATYAAARVEGRQVALEFDDEKFDGSERLLAYVVLPGGGLFNEYLVRTGYAQADINPPNIAHAADLRQAQEQARSLQAGLWSLPPDKLCQLPGHSPAIPQSCDEVPAVAPQENEPEAPVADVPPLPPDGDYDCGHFASQEQAQKVLDNDPSDPHQLDGEDGDGEACEQISWSE